MPLTLLRRRTRLEQVPVVTSLFWDVAAETPAVEEPAQPKPPAVPPSYVPGLCWHKAHVYLDGDRYGVTPLAGRAPYQQAAITPCEHLSRVGGR